MAANVVSAPDWRCVDLREERCNADLVVRKTNDVLRLLANMSVASGPALNC